MNKPASELIALADREAFIEVQGKYLDLTECPDAWGRPMFMHPLIQAMWDGWRKGRDALRTAANQSGSERAGVNALREALVGLNASLDHWWNGDRTNQRMIDICEWQRKSQATLATPPAQPAPASGETVTEGWCLEMARQEEIAGDPDCGAGLLSAIPSDLMTDDQIKYMVDRFLMWKLPEHFNPDCGISFDPKYRDAHSPIGTNLFDAVQATEMVRHMLDGMPCHGKPDGVVRAIAWWLNEIEACNERMRNGSKGTYFGQIAKGVEIIRAALHSPEIAAAETSPGPALNEAEIRAGINILLETIAAKLEANDTLDIWRSDAASLVRSYKHANVSMAETSPGDVLAMKEAKDALKLALEYWSHRQQRYKNRHPAWVAAARAAIDRLDVKAEAKSQEPDAVKPDHRIYFACECCENYAPENGVSPVDDIAVMPDGTWLCSGCYADCEKSAYGLVASDVTDFEYPDFDELPKPKLYTHPTTKPEAPAVSVDAIARLIDPDSFCLCDETGGLLRTVECDEATTKATAIAALIAGGR